MMKTVRTDFYSKTQRVGEHIYVGEGETIGTGAIVLKVHRADDLVAR